MPYQINCELCGRLIDALRRSKQYCGICRPKAVVMNRVVKALNLAATTDPVTVNQLMEMGFEMSSPFLAGILPGLETVHRISPMTFLNLALREYGLISWDGEKFEIVRWPDIQVQVGADFSYGHGSEAYVVMRDGRVLDVHDLVTESRAAPPIRPAPRDGYGRYR